MSADAPPTHATNTHPWWLNIWVWWLGVAAIYYLLGLISILTFIFLGDNDTTSMLSGIIENIYPVLAFGLPLNVDRMIPSMSHGSASSVIAFVVFLICMTLYQKWSRRFNRRAVIAIANLLLLLALAGATGLIL